MKIVVLDGYTLNPGDLDWKPLEALGPCLVFDRTRPEEVQERAADAEIVLTNKTVLDRETIGKLTLCRYIGVLATGVNVVDLTAARTRNIPVTNVPAYSTASVAQMVFAHILHHTQQVDHHSRMVREGAWSRSPDFCFWDRPLVELAGLILGVVGFGRIGRRVAELGQAFGMDVRVHTAHPDRHLDEPHGKRVKFVTLEDLFRSSDVLTLHCPLNTETERLINSKSLGWMKPTALLINAGRGPLVDEKALADALAAGRIAGAGLDVLTAEPPAGDNPLLSAPACTITPHIAWATRAARERLMHVAVENVRRYLEGNAQNVVN